MKKTIQSLLALGAFASAAFTVQAQPTPKIATVDMAKLYEGHWKTQDQMATLKKDQDAAQKQYDQMTKDLNTIKAQVDELAEQAKNPTATADAVKTSQEAAQKKYEELQARLNDRNTFGQTVQREFQQRMQNFHDLMMEEIGAKVTEAAKSHGDNLVLDKSGITVLGSHAIIYSDAAFDLTDEVAAAIARDHPASPASSMTTPAPMAPAASSTPQISLPPIAPAK
jgi:outer membrane protein